MHLFTDPVRMISDIRGLGGGISRWGAALNFPQLLGGLLFIFTLEGVVILLVNVFCLIVAGQIHRREKFSRFISICHVPWLALVPWLIYRLMTVDYSGLMTAWLIYVLVTIIISLIFDIREIWLYAKGDRTFAWARERNS